MLDNLSQNENCVVFPSLLSLDIISFIYVKLKLISYNVLITDTPISTTSFKLSNQIFTHSLWFHVTALIEMGNVAITLLFMCIFYLGAAKFI